jgi:penicillin-binding protein 2B
VALLKGEGFDPEIAGGGTVIVEQTPPPGTMMARNATVTVRTNDNTRMLPGGVALVPDLRGLSMRRAINSLTLQHLDASIVGSGTVVGQTPRPGERVRQGTVVTVRCEPRSSASISS